MAQNLCSSKFLSSFRDIISIGEFLSEPIPFELNSFVPHGLRNSFKRFEYLPLLVSAKEIVIFDRFQSCNRQMNKIFCQTWINFKKNSYLRLPYLKQATIENGIVEQSFALIAESAAAAVCEQNCPTIVDEESTPSQFLSQSRVSEKEEIIKEVINQKEQVNQHTIFIVHFLLPFMSFVCRMLYQKTFWFEGNHATQMPILQNLKYFAGYVRWMIFEVQEVGSINSYFVSALSRRCPEGSWFSHAFVADLSLLSTLNALTLGRDFFKLIHLPFLN